MMSVLTFRSLAWFAFASMLFAAALLPSHTRAAEPDWKNIESAYTAEIRSLVTRYCQECHSEDRTEAEIDLAALKTFADVRKQPTTWVKVREMLESGQMPPP